MKAIAGIDFEASMVRMFGAGGEYSCKTHGDYHAWENNSQCNECGKEASEKAERIAASEHRAAIAAGRWARCGMPEKFCGITLAEWISETPEQNNAKRHAESFASGDINRMLFIGNCGTGKTMLAAGVIGQMASGNRNPTYTTATRMIRSIRDTWKDGTSEQAAMDRFISADVLVIDELGAGRCTEDDKLILSEILCDRYAIEKATLLISNLTAEQIKATVMDERATDRMREGGKIVPMMWASKRRGM